MPACSSNVCNLFVCEWFTNIGCDIDLEVEKPYTTANCFVAHYANPRSRKFSILEIPPAISGSPHPAPRVQQICTLLDSLERIAKVVNNLSGKIPNYSHNRYNSPHLYDTEHFDDEWLAFEHLCKLKGKVLWADPDRDSSTKCSLRSQRINIFDRKPEFAENLFRMFS